MDAEDDRFNGQLIQRAVIGQPYRLAVNHTDHTHTVGQPIPPTLVCSSPQCSQCSVVSDISPDENAGQDIDRESVGLQDRLISHREEKEEEDIYLAQKQQ